MAPQVGTITRRGSLYGGQFNLDRIAHLEGTTGGVELTASVPIEVVVNKEYDPVPVASNAAAPTAHTRLTWAVPPSAIKPYFNYEIKVTCLASGGPHHFTLSHF